MLHVDQVLSIDESGDATENNQAAILMSIWKNVHTDRRLA